MCIWACQTCRSWKNTQNKKKITPNGHRDEKWCLLQESHWAPLSYNRTTIEQSRFFMKILILKAPSSWYRAQSSKVNFLHISEFQIWKITKKSCPTRWLLDGVRYYLDGAFKINIFMKKSTLLDGCSMVARWWFDAILVRDIIFHSGVRLGWFFFWFWVFFQDLHVWHVNMHIWEV